ncbi:NYN domain-containing protein [Candidatus Uhrbacteria bacterium]|nr:NYN domain-containing protein [Candidatus Uhrbacteria bacterium]
MSEKERVAVFIDGSNLYYRMKELGILSISKFDYRALAEFLALDRDLVYAGYYVGVVKAKPDNTKGQELRTKQQKLFSHLTSPQQNFDINRGVLIRSDSKYHEKGVDVRIAVDLLVGAFDNMYDTAILLSSDSDLVPAVQKVTQFKKKIEYVGFSHRPTYALQKVATRSKLLLREELIAFQVKLQNDELEKQNFEIYL